VTLLLFLCVVECGDLIIRCLVRPGKNSAANYFACFFHVIENSPPSNRQNKTTVNEIKLWTPLLKTSSPGVGNASSLVARPLLGLGWGGVVGWGGDVGVGSGWAPE